jgi:NAD(P)-dependent dehydrogenase (short-subunit alcohol dehydrogenase family)
MKKILVTGASSGIGRAIAELLVAQGHEVWGTSRATSMTRCSSRWASPISTCGKINRMLVEKNGSVLRRFRLQEFSIFLQGWQFTHCQGTLSRP